VKLLNREIVEPLNCWIVELSPDFRL